MASVQQVRPLGELWMTAAQAAKYLKLPSVAALYQAVRRGDVPAYLLGNRRLRFSREDLDGVIRRAPRRRK